MFARDPLAHPEDLIRRVYAYVGYRLGEGPHAEDVVGDTFERALRYRGSYDPAKGPPIAWLTGIARRCVLEYLASSSSHEHELPDIATSEDVERDVAERDEVARALRRLSERDRELIALRYGADLSARQIAEQLEMQTNAVEVALHRALSRLRPMLEAEPQLPDATHSNQL